MLLCCPQGSKAITDVARRGPNVTDRIALEGGVKRSGLTVDTWRRRGAVLALLRGSGWRRALAAERAPELAAASSAAVKVRRGRLRDGAGRSARRLRRLGLGEGVSE